MPLARYFFWVGGVLLALLFASDAYLPKLPMAASAERSVDKSIIRIHSDRKWPERVVFDTQQPTIIPSMTASNVVPSVPASPTVADISGKARARQSFAELQTSDQNHGQATEPKQLEKKAVHKRRIVKRRTAPPVMLVAQQPQFGFFGMNTW
jgi:hypothetical protein